MIVPEVTVPLTPAASADYSSYVNPQWVRLLDLLEMNATYTRCEGVELSTADGRTILDFLSGYCVHNTGHNHPAIVARLQEELQRRGPAMLQSHVPEHAGELARRLCALANGPDPAAKPADRLTKVFFACSGSEGVESAIKFSRAATRRDGLLYAHGAFHGLTCGALSLMGDGFWREKFGPLLENTAPVTFGDARALEAALATKKYAAFVVEAFQSESGIHPAPDGYLKEARQLCSKYGTLLVLDEVQTGMFRTGRFLAAHHSEGADPDMVVLAKALSGGLVPCSALLMTDDVYKAVYSSLKRSIIHTSTFSENSLSMCAGLATLDVLESENLGQRALASGEYLRGRLREQLAGFEMVHDVRGLGLLSGIEFRAPRSAKLRVAFEAFRHIHESMFGQVIVMRLFRDQGILTQICGNNFMVLKVAPPLVASEEHLDRFVAAIRAVTEEMHTSSSFWTEPLGLARRVLNI